MSRNAEEFRTSQRVWAATLMTLALATLSCNFVAGLLEGSPTPNSTSEAKTTALPSPTAEARPTDTPDPTPTLASAGDGELPVPTEEDGRREISPEQLLPNVTWGGWGGGSGREECGDSVPNVYLTAYGASDPNPANAMREDNSIVTGEWLLVNGCDLPLGEQVQVTFILPDGTTETATTEGGTFWQVEWWSLPGEPLGEYGIVIRSDSLEVEERFTVAAPDEPVLTTACGGGEPTGLVLLTGFQPAEEVLIARYICCGWPEDPPNLADHFFVDIEADGTALVETSSEPALLAAIGQERPRELGFDPSMEVSAFDFMGEGPGRCLN